MSAPELSQSDLDRIAEEFSEAIRGGAQPTVEQFLTRYPDSSGQLAELLTSIAMIEELKQQSSLSSASDTAKQLQLDQLDDYTIVREIGRGGMGIVFEAIHQSLGRRVAIKVLPPEFLPESKQLARFRVEARAAARLRHSNIVPVFGVGKSGPHHYYVMDYIDGLSLRDWLAQRLGGTWPSQVTADETIVNTPEQELELASIGQMVAGASAKQKNDHKNLASFWAADSKEHIRWAARVGATICDALAYAHQQGVLHRDIKPANLLIDNNNDVWIADFGLAKLAEQQALTKTGDVVGTPQYMPPESFDGVYDQRSEVYCVGLTLFELLAMRPAILGGNAGDTIRLASSGVTVSPRAYNSGLPRDLETIVLKALHREPTQRYSSSADMRDDLRRFLAGEPVSARRISILERAALWYQREPAVFLLTTFSFLMFVSLAIVGITGYVRTSAALSTAESATAETKSALQKKTEALSIADQQRRRAENNLQVALAAFDQITTNIAQRTIEVDADVLGEVTDTTASNVTPDDAKLLQSLLTFFDELATNNSEQLLAESATAARRAGDIYVSLGELRQAERAYNEALARYERMAAQIPQSVEMIVSQAKIMNELVVISSLRGDIQRSNQLFYETLDLFEASDEAMKDSNGIFQYARANRLFASLGSRSGLDGIAANNRGPGPRPRRPLSGRLRVRSEQDLDAIDTAIELLNELIDESSDEVRFKAELARAYRNRAEVASRAKRRGDTESALRQSIDLWEELLKGNRRSDAIRYELATTLVSTDAFGFNQMFRAARARDLSRQLFQSAPELPRYQALWARSLQNIASLQKKTGDLEAAENNLHEAAGIYSDLLKTSPDLVVYETRRAQTYELLADLKIRQDDIESAITYLERAIRSFRPRFDRPAPSTVARMQLQRLRQKLNRLTQPTAEVDDSESR